MPLRSQASNVVNIAPKYKPSANALASYSPLRSDLLPTNPSDGVISSRELQSLRGIIWISISKIVFSLGQKRSLLYKNSNYQSHQTLINLNKAHKSWNHKLYLYLIDYSTKKTLFFLIFTSFSFFKVYWNDVFKRLLWQNLSLLTRAKVF